MRVWSEKPPWAVVKEGGIWAGARWMDRGEEEGFQEGQRQEQ